MLTGRRREPGRRRSRSSADHEQAALEDTPAPPRSAGGDGMRATRQGAAAAALLGGTAAVEEQLRRVESRLMAEAAGDPALAGDVRRLLDDARLRFSSATVRQFVPILVERDVRRRLREVAEGDPSVTRFG
jgi:hypothetical protein